MFGDNIYHLIAPERRNSERVARRIPAELNVSRKLVNNKEIYKLCANIWYGASDKRSRSQIQREVIPFIATRRSVTVYLDIINICWKVVYNGSQNSEMWCH